MAHQCRNLRETDQSNEAKNGQGKVPNEKRLLQFKGATVAHHPLNEPNEGVIGNRYSNGVVPMPLSNGGLGNTGRKYLEKEGPANLKVIRVSIINQKD